MVRTPADARWTRDRAVVASVRRPRETGGPGAMGLRFGHGSPPESAGAGRRKLGELHGIEVFLVRHESLIYARVNLST